MSSSKTIKTESISKETPITDLKPASSQTEVEKLKQQIVELETKSAENLAGWQRAKADYLNLKQTQVATKNLWQQQAKLEIIHPLLALADYFKQALTFIPDNLVKKEWVIGLNHISDLIQQILKQEKIEKIKVIGEIFDPQIHESVAVEKDITKKEGEIIAEVSPGYKFKEEVIKFPKVKIINNTN